MLRLIGCVSEEHDVWLVGVAVIVCLLACLTAMNLVGRALSGTGASRLGWVLASAASFGGGVWATHFIAMLAYRPGLPYGFAIPLTIVSLLLPILGTTAGIALLAYVGRNSLTRVTAGFVIGAAVCAMHFTGMAAMQVPADLVYDPPTALVACIVGVAFAIAAIFAYAHGLRIVSVVLMALSVCGLHFIAMSALTLVPDPDHVVPASSLPPAPLAMAVAAVAVMILTLSLTATVMDGRRVRLLEAEAERLRRLLDATFEGILFHRDGVVTEVNASLAAMLAADREALVGRKVSDVLGADLPTGGAPDGEPERLERELRSEDGKIYPVELLTRPMTGVGRGKCVVAVRDLTERKRAERRIQHLARHDTLTGLANRAQLAEAIGRALSQGDRSRRGVALLSIDLDGFKAANDLLGSRGGDQLLAAAAARLVGSIRQMDTVARIGGDEFAILQPLADQPQAAAALAERVVRTLAQPFEIDGQSIGIGASVGIALFPADAGGVEDLMRHADLAMDRAKADGKGTFRFFEPGMDERVKERRQLEIDLRQALANQEFELHYQGQFAAGSLELLGYEALLRWNHPRLGRVSPAVFVPIAESSGMIRQIGQWVLDTACREAANWPNHLRLCVNLSPAQFRWRDLSERVFEAMRRTGLAPERLELEITEGVLMDDTDRAMAILRELKAHGVRMALDDFGTGYSSLSYLRRFRFDTLKIDKSFVQAIGEDAEADAIVKAIIALGHSLGLDVIAEGVETPEQLGWLRAMRCQQVQGYLLAKPLPAAQLPHLVAEPMRA